ncbi:LOW QUALITY PROTEIN: uncharacterized protein LOC135467341 [Liolophura sinensis]|uniref:LOW QUALITY PROTEIN: uncharacterized protein LOC135467341 n=1 Tax=Liolophura sinensis TaxID=3198878 RepID=UPI003158F700
MLGCIGVDVGGTNTDAVLLRGKEVLCTAKKPTSRDVICGVKQAIRTVLARVKKTDPSVRIVQINIGTTHFVNAVVQRQNLAKVSVIRLCGTASTGIPPYMDFPRDLAEVIRGEVYMINGGYQFDGQEISSIAEEEIRTSAEDSRKKGVNNFVICGVFSPVNNGQEVKVGELLKSAFPDISFTLSHEVGYIGLLERENAAILNECLKPLCQQTIHGFQEALTDLGVTCPFYLTQNDGTITSSTEAIRYPVTTFASGPTNSMRGAAFLSDEADCIVVDIGGTTTDVGALQNGFPREASSQIKVGGVRTNFRMPDVFSIGLGGGSFVSISDNLQKVTVGPRSTGYRLLTDGLAFGGKTLTATDAAVLMGMVEIGDKSKVQQCVSVEAARATVDKIQVMLEDCIDQIKISKDDTAVILVGGGSILVDNSSSLRGVKRLIKPPHFQVANAIGAAICQVSSTVDYVVSLTNLIGEDRFAKAVSAAEKSVSPEDPEHRRTAAVERTKTTLFAEAKSLAKKQATEKAKTEMEALGADPSTLQLVEVLDVTLAYIPGNACRIRVKVVGDLSQRDSQHKAVEVGTLKLSEEELSASLELDQQMQNTTTTGQSLDPLGGIIPFLVDPNKYKPNVNPSTGEWILSEFDMDCIAVGAGILGCGGGGNPHLGNLVAKRKLREGKTVRVISVERYQDTASPGTAAMFVGFIGAPVVLTEKLESGRELPMALGAMETLLKIQGDRAAVLQEHGCEVHNTDHITCCDNFQSITALTVESSEENKVTALLCIEIGGFNSVKPLMLGAEMSLPVVDCDGMGRAFPELQMFTPFIYGHKPCPASLADDKGRQAVALRAESPKYLEDYFRGICVDMGCSAAITINVLNPTDLSSMVVHGSISRAWHLGLAVLQSRANHTSPITAITDQLNGQLLVTGKICDVSREVTGGFNRGVMVIEGLGEYAGQEVAIDFQNENLVARSKHDNTILACTPDLITCVDAESGEPVTTEDIRFGLRVSVLVLPSCPEMTSPEALSVVGPHAFGYTDVVYKPVGRFIKPKPVPQ